MAESCHVSPSYFSKFFKKTIGMGFKEYVTFTRLTVSGESSENHGFVDS